MKEFISAAVADHEWPETAESGVNAEVLRAPMSFRGETGTVGGYLAEILLRVWEHGENFSGKRPLGFSGWHWDFYRALSEAGLIESTIDSDGEYEISDTERVRADALITNAIRSLAGVSR